MLSGAFFDTGMLAPASIRGAATFAEWLLVVLGMAIVAVTALDVTRTLVVTTSRNTAARRQNFILFCGGAVARRFKSYSRRAALPVWFPAIMIVGMLAMWLLFFLIGYALIMRGLIVFDMSTAFREAGSSLFTLGFASVDRERLSYIDFIAGATGPITIGLLISYLPTIYSSYNRREVDVALLKTRYGEPNWGPEILARQAEVNLGRERELAFWHEWEHWAADVTETHTTHSVLIYMRSSDPMRSWVISLLSLLDAAALSMSLNPSHKIALRVFLRQAIVCVHEIALSLRLPRIEIHSGDSPIDLTEAEYLAACEMLADRGYARERSPEDAWPDFRNWRRLYESSIYAIARKLDVAPALWSGPRRPATPQILPQLPFYEISADGTLTYPIDASLPKNSLLPCQCDDPSICRHQRRRAP